MRNASAVTTTNVSFWDRPFREGRGLGVLHLRLGAMASVNANGKAAVINHFKGEERTNP